MTGPADTTPADPRSAWLLEVLGFRAPAPLTVAPTVPPTATPAADPAVLWRDAKDAVDARLDTLARHLRTIGDDRLDTIAELGLYALTGPTQTVALATALQDHAADPAKAAALRAAAATYRASLATSRVAALIDQNPFGVPVALTETLTAAIDQILATLP